jgi:hypothetical protein
MVGKEIDLAEKMREDAKKARVDAITKSVLKTLEKFDRENYGWSIDATCRSSPEDSDEDVEEKPRKKPTKKIVESVDDSDDSDGDTEEDVEEKPPKKPTKKIVDLDEDSDEDVEEKPSKKPHKKVVDVDKDESYDEHAYKSYGFYMHDKTINLTHNHVPLWDGNTCVVCGYECANIIIPTHEGNIYVM